MKEKYLLEISNGRGKIYNHRYYFRENDFAFNKRSYGKSYYARKFQTEDEMISYISYCKNNGLKYRTIESSYIRDNSYRKNYFESNDFLKQRINDGYALCAYCGLPVKINDLTVDHIVPVVKAKNTQIAKGIMKIMKISNINERKNLCGACSKCNSKKRANMGLWIIRGIIGKSKYVWLIRWILRIVFLALLVYIYKMYGNFIFSP